jgi:hypothetical protein
MMSDTEARRSVARIGAPRKPAAPSAGAPLKSTAGAKPGQYLRVHGTVLKTSETQRAVRLMRDILGHLALPKGGRRERGWATPPVPASYEGSQDEQGEEGLKHGRRGQ